jgi:CheY-like chemotaxis protein
MARILVIDDQAFVRDVIQRLLESAGHQVLLARDGEQGLRLLQEQPADLVLCDLFMPGQGGLQTIRDLRRGWPGLPVVAVSVGSCGSAEDALPAAQALGAVAALRKPFTPDALLRTVEQALRAPGDERPVVPPA